MILATDLYVSTPIPVFIGQQSTSTVSFQFSLIGTLQIGYLDLGAKDDDDDDDDGNSGKANPPSYMAASPKPDAFAVPAPIVTSTKTKAKHMPNVLPPKNDQTDDIEEDYKEPWEK